MLIRPSTRSSWKRLVVYFSRFVCFVYDYLCKKKRRSLERHHLKWMDKFLGYVYFELQCFFV